MAGGNPNKVNAIVDEIVKNNNSFKLKSPIEQDKEKDSIARSINSAISVLNEVGKELVLQDLSIDPDEKFKGFIDSVGNIDILGLTQMTSTIVKAKIEEAEREGVDLRQGETVFKDDTKFLLVGGILTVAVIDNMIKNYDNLSNEDIQSLIKGYDSMPPEYQDAFNKAQADNLKKIAEGIQDENLKNALNQQANNTEGLRNRNETDLDKFNSNPNMQVQYIIERLSKTKGLINGLKELKFEVDISRIQTLFDVDNTENLFALLSQKSHDELIDIFRDIQSIYNEASHQANYCQRKLQNDKEKGNRSEFEYRKSAIKIANLANEAAEPLKDPKIQDSHYNIKNNESLAEHYKINNLLKGTTDIKIFQEIEQLPSALAKANFSQEEINEALIQYKTLMEQLPEKYISKLENASTEDVPNMLNIILTKKGNIKPEISEILSTVNYDGQLLTILRDESKRKEFIEQLNQVIKPKKEQQPIQDKHTDDYYHSQNETLKVDGNVEKIAQDVRARGGSVEEITEELVKKAKEKITEQTKQSILEEQPKEPKLSEETSQVAEFKIAPEEHTQESVISPEQEISEETSQNMAIVEQDNSFIGKIKRVFANMRDMKNKDNSKGFFARLGASIQTVFGKKDEYSENQDKPKEETHNANSSKTEQPISFDEQLRQGIDQNKFNHLNIPKGTIKEEKDSLNRDEDYEQK